MGGHAPLPNSATPVKGRENILHCVTHYQIPSRIEKQQEKGKKDNDNNGRRKLGVFLNGTVAGSIAAGVWTYGDLKKESLRVAEIKGIYNKLVQVIHLLIAIINFQITICTCRTILQKSLNSTTTYQLYLCLGKFYLGSDISYSNSFVINTWWLCMLKHQSSNLLKADSNSTPSKTSFKQHQIS